MPLLRLDDGIETRFRSWTDYQTPSCGVFRMGLDEGITDAEIVPTATWGEFVSTWHRISREHAKRVGVL